MPAHASTTNAKQGVVAKPREQGSAKRQQGSVREGGVPTGRIIIAPHLTEKASMLAERGQYTFLVARNAEKVAIARAIAAQYAVHPTHVNIVRIAGKRVRFGNREGQRADSKKAIVTLRKGEKIPFGVRA